MICTIKIEFKPNWENFKYELKRFIEKFDKPMTGNPNDPPLFYLNNFRVTTRNKALMVEGSLAKYYKGNNINPFLWTEVKSAIYLLSHELGLPLYNGILRRIDIGVNFEVNDEVVKYFPEIFHLDFYQRIHKKKTTLRFENNSHRFNYCFYDKKKEVEDKRKNDEDEILVSKYTNLMRVELQIEERLEFFLKRKESIRVYELFSQKLCKLLLKQWLELYLQIQKKGVLLFPKEAKGLKDFDALMRREFIQENGWAFLDYRLEQLVKQKSLTRKDKSEKKKQFRTAMLDKRSFIYQKNTQELNHKMRIMAVEGLKQIFKMP